MRYSEIFKEARRLHALGFGILWLHPRSKRPVESGWTKGDRQTWAELEATYRPGYNMGVRTGQASKLARGYLACIDVDIKDEAFRKTALARLKALLGEHAPPEVRSGSGNGSRHLYCATPEPFKMITVEKSLETFKDEKGKKHHKWEICVYSTGRQMVLPPSVHPDSGKLYSWKTFLTKAQDLPLIDFQAVTADNDVDDPDTGLARANPYDGVAGAAGGLGRPGQGGQAGLAGKGGGSVREAHPASERSGGATPLENFKVEPVELSWLPISEDVRAAIVEGKGVTDRSGYLLKASSALISAGLSQNEVLTVLTDPETFLGACGYDHAKTKDRTRAAEWVYRYTVKKVADERSAAGVFTKASEMPAARKLTEEEMEAQAEEFAADRSWRQELDHTKEGGIRSTLRNLNLILTNAVDQNLFVEDLFASRIEYGSDSPWGRKEKIYIEDIDQTLLKHWVSENYGIEPSSNLILEATSLIAHRKSYHPVRDYLQGLKWDGVKRIDTWVKDFCRGVAPEPFLSEVSRKFMLALVKRVFEPGCQWDYVLVLEGHQGKKKSSAARAIAGDKWFMDNLPDLRDKDSMLSLQGKWLIELGELAGVKRTDYSQVKAYLSRRQDTVRPHYGRLARDVPRQSVFIGTVNEGQYFKDPTGNRRFWPVKTGLCDVEGLTRMRDQLFAEAMELHRVGVEKLFLSEEAEAQAKELQEERRIDDDETEMREALDIYLQKPDEPFDPNAFTIRELTAGTAAPWGRWSQERYFTQTAAQVLRNLGFERRKVQGQRVWGRVDFSVEKIGGIPPTRYAPNCAPLPPENDEMDFY